MTKYSLDEVRKHKSKDSLWVAHKGKVYDVTNFLDRHPGGGDILMAKGGGDVTEVMKAASHDHSPAAYQILNKYCIGELQHHDGTLQKAESNKSVTNGHAKGTPRDDEHTGGCSMLGWREDEIIDWNKPIFWQVGRLGKNYHDWVHSPVDRHIRLFHSDFVEFFSETPWWVIPILWVPAVLFFLYSGVCNLHQASITGGFGSRFIEGGAQLSAVGIGLFAFGVLLWTLLEYTVHRWLFHLDPPAESPFLITMHFILHGQHHKAPFDKDRLVFPPVPATAFAFFFWVLYNLIFPEAISQIVMSGTILGYVFYDLTHYYLHHGTPRLDYFKSLKTYHVKHHFVDQQKGFGISSKLWDYPFNTLIPKSPRHNNNNKKQS